MTESLEDTLLSLGTTTEAKLKTTRLFCFLSLINASTKLKRTRQLFTILTTRAHPSSMSGSKLISMTISNTIDSASTLALRPLASAVAIFVALELKIMEDSKASSNTSKLLSSTFTRLLKTADAQMDNFAHMIKTIIHKEHVKNAANMNS